MLFEDDFENGRLPEWDIPEGQEGELFYVNGTVTVTGDVWMFVGSTDWKNYEVTFEADIVDIDGYGSEPHQPTMILVRVVDTRNMIALRYWGSDIDWVIIENGEEKPVPNTRIQKPSDRNLISVIVIGNVYRFAINGIEGPSFNMDIFPNGRVGMRIYSGTTVNNFKVVELP